MVHMRVVMTARPAGSENAAIALLHVEHFQPSARPIISLVPLTHDHGEERKAGTYLRKTYMWPDGT